MASTPKKIFPLVLVVAVLAGIVIALRAHRSSNSSEEHASANASSTAANLTNRAPASISRASTAPVRSTSTQATSEPTPATPSEPQKPETPFVLGAADAPPAMDPATVVDKMRVVIHNYGSMFNGNPVGTNPEITAELNGGNPKGVKFISEDSGLRINGRGELVDYWGTPFFFHQISGTEMEIRSAGPDKKMWTADDILTK